VVGVVHGHPLDREGDADGVHLVHVRVEGILQLQRLERAARLPERHAAAARPGKVPVEAGADHPEDRIRFDAAVLGEVDRFAALERRFVDEAAGLRRGDSGYGPVRPRVDLEDVAVPPRCGHPVGAAGRTLDYLLAGEPGIGAADPAGAVRRRSAEDREVADDGVRVELLPRRRIRTRLRPANLELRVPRERRLVVLERARDDLLLAGPLAVLVISDQDRRPGLARVGGHPVEDAGRRLPVAHRDALT
jgi:hypothetical protein